MFVNSGNIIIIFVCFFVYLGPRNYFDINKEALTVKYLFSFNFNVANLLNADFNF